MSNKRPSSPRYTIRLKRSKAIICADKMYGYWFNRDFKDQKVLTYSRAKAKSIVKNEDLEGGEGSPSNMNDKAEAVPLAQALREVLTS